MNPNVLIIMPVYNREKLVSRSIQSILDQTFTNWHLCIVDDNSTDNSAAVIQKYVNMDKRISSKINTECSHSAAGARNSGLLELNVHYDYVAFLDSDDQWSENHLQTSVNFLAGNEDTDIIFGDLRRVDINGNILSKSKFFNEKRISKIFHLEWFDSIAKIQNKELLPIVIQNRFAIGLHSSVFKRQVFDNISIPEIKIGEDFLFTLKIIEKNYKFVLSRDVHLLYLVHDSNLSSCNSKDSFNKKLEVLNTELEMLHIIPNVVTLNDKSKKILAVKIADLNVWQLGNNVYRDNGMKMSALKYIFQGIKLRPFHLSYWKSLIGTMVRT